MVPPLQGFACLLSVTQGVAGLAWGRAFGPRYSAPLVLQRRFRDPPVFNCVWCDSGLAGSDPSPDSDTNRLRGNPDTENDSVGRRAPKLTLEHFKSKCSRDEKRQAGGMRGGTRRSARVSVWTARLACSRKKRARSDALQCA